MIQKIVISAFVVCIIVFVVVIVINRVRQLPMTSGVQNSLEVSKGESETMQQNNIEGSELKLFTLEEVSKHNNKNDCWLVIDNKVYDVTSFIALGKHPPQIEMGCGKDATKLFRERTTEEGEKVGSGTPHSENAKRLLENYYIGNVKEE